MRRIIRQSGYIFAQYADAAGKTTTENVYDEAQAAWWFDEQEKPGCHNVYVVKNGLVKTDYCGVYQAHLRHSDSTEMRHFSELHAAKAWLECDRIANGVAQAGEWQQVGLFEVTQWQLN